MNDLTDRFLKRQQAKAALDLIPTNRAERRAMGFRGPVDPDWVQHETSNFVPRFVRRHHTEKKARAKVMRLMAERMPS